MMMRRILMMTICGFSLVAAQGSRADVSPDLSKTCLACHGGKGISVNSLWPNLAGQKADYLIKQLTDFQEGRRTDPLMGPISKTLSEQDIKLIAQYYSSL